MTQSHGLTIWTEPAGVGATPTLAPVYFVSDGAGNVVPSLTGPERYVFYQLGPTGDYTLVDLTPVYLVNDGAGNAVPSSAGPAGYVLADGGSGDVELTSDLTRAAVVDLYYDPGGDLWLVLHTTPRLYAVQVRGDVQLY